VLGRIVGVFGVRGELKLQPSRVGEDALRDEMYVTLRFDDARESRAVRIRRIRPHKSLIVAALEGVDDAVLAQTFVGAMLSVPRAQIALATDEYFDEDLVGCRLMQNDRVLGSVVAIRHYPAQDVLELQDGKLVPFVRAFVRRIDLEERVVRVELPPGLLEGEPELG
jgi:16S rRNA processing protein RimM